MAKKPRPVGRMINGKVFGLSTPARHANANANPVPTVLNDLKPIVLPQKITD